MMSISQVILRNRYLESYSIVHRTPGARNTYGEWVFGEIQCIAHKGVSVPTSGGDLRDLAFPGIRLDDVRKFYTVVVEGVSITSSDRVLYKGKTYQILRVESWPGDFWVIDATLEEPQPDTLPCT